MQSTTAVKPHSLGAGIDPIQALVRTDLAAVNRVIEVRLHSEVSLVDEVSHHIIHSGGKRLRPLLVLLGARACGYPVASGDEKHVVLAAVVEFIHTATLLHDDVVDGSLLRRGRETANVLYGSQASVLVGDFLYSRAFEMMVDVGDMQIMQIMAETTNVIAEGEVMQLLNCHQPDTNESQYRKVIRAKTAKLFEAAAEIGAVLARRSAEETAAMAAYGRHVGTAYQLVDDVLDYYGSPDEIGKNVGDDLAEGKPTLPLIYAMATATPAHAAVIRDAIQHGRAEAIAEVIAAVSSTDAVRYTTEAARVEAAAAHDALQFLPESPHRDALQALVEFSVNRTY